MLGDPPFTLGWDVAGTVESTGPGVSTFVPGDEVLGLLAFPGPGNAYADYMIASHDEIVHRPAALSVPEAGGLPLAGLTAWQALAGIADVGDPGLTPERAAELGVRFAVVSVRPSAPDLSRLTALAEAGGLRVHVDQTLPLTDAAKAHELLSARRTTGKIVLIP
ncbi:zinc-binding dehydrogenase [Streptosporangium sp. NPDC050855]|uniref:zinc-binding dehydrogenase n=1 Tax=Streptosporangium sp. NPDC050855 TaxID=3366194 RepID=UPI003794D4EF